MPTLSEFITKTMIENNLAFNTSDVEKYIIDEAKKRANKNDVVAISDDDVREMIIGYKADSKKEVVEKKQEKEECETNQQYQTPLF